MAKYRPIDIRLWNDRKFLSLSDDGRMLWLFLLSTPQSMPIPGVIVAGQAAIAELLGWSLGRLGGGLRELSQNGLSISVEGRLVWLRNALKYQPPTSPHVITGWSKTWDDVPEGELKHELWQALKIACKRWDRAFARLFPEPSRHSSRKGIGEGPGDGSRQEQEQDQEQEREERASLSEAEPTPLPSKPPGESAPIFHGGPPKIRRHDPKHLKLAHQTWQLALKEHTRLKLALRSDAQSWPAMPSPSAPAFEELVFRIAELGDLPDLWPRLQNRIAVAIAEAEQRGDLNYFSPYWLSKREQFARAVDETPEQVRRRGAKAGAETGRGLVLSFGDEESEAV